MSEKIKNEEGGNMKKENSSTGMDDDICELEHLRKLFIGGLASYTTEESLKVFYGQWGKVVDVVVMRDPETKRSRGFGFITYTKSEMVDKAQDNRPHVIDGKKVETKRALPRPERKASDNKNISVKKIFVGGLKDNHDDQCLKEYFAKFGNVVSVKILSDRSTGKRRGFAFIEFDDYDAVDKAILQKTHSIKYVVVDVKKSVYNQELQKKNVQNQMNLNSSGENGQMSPPDDQSTNSNMRQQLPPQPMQPYAQGPPPNYNQWGLPPPSGMPPQNYNAYQSPPNWNYPPGPNAWNVPPPPPNAQPPVWQNNQWGGPPPIGPPAPVTMPVNNGAPPSAQPNNWQQVQPTAPINPGAGQPQVQQTPNFGSGYQQNYGGGPSKQNNSHPNRMNPYNVPPNATNTYNTSNTSQTPGYGGYNIGNSSTPSTINAPTPGPVPNPMANGNVTSPNVNNANTYRR